MRYRNVIGRQLAKLRYQRSLSQSDLARKLQLAGWDISRSEISKIEMRIREVKDWQMVILTEVFKVPHEAFYPKFDPNMRFTEAFSEQMKSRSPNKKLPQ